MKNRLLEEFKNHSNICDQMFEERFTSSKHKDKWNNDLYQNYIISKERVTLLIEMVETDYEMF